MDEGSNGLLDKSKYLSALCFPMHEGIEPLKKLDRKFKYVSELCGKPQNEDDDKGPLKKLLLKSIDFIVVNLPRHVGIVPVNLL